MDKIDKLVEAIHKGQKSSAPQTFSTREMSSLDDLTHNFTGDPDITRAFLLKYGQVFMNGQRFTK